MVALRFDPIRCHYEASTVVSRYILVRVLLSWFVALRVDPIRYRTEAFTSLMRFMFRYTPGVVCLVALRFDPIRCHCEAFTFVPRYILVGVIVLLVRNTLLLAGW